MSKLTASFCLNTCNAVKNSKKTNITWSNINLKDILRDEWDKYDRFKLILADVAYAKNTNSVANGTLMISISGLPFENCTYQITATGNRQTNNVQLCPLSVVQAGAVMQYFDYTGCIFNKNQHLCNLNLNIVRVYDLVEPSQTLPEMSFLFHIVGIDD